MSSEKKLGFAAMSPERQREIASMGGKAVPAEKRSYFRNRDLARRAGGAGGSRVPAEKRTFSTDRVLASEAGAKGGRAVPPHKRTFTTNPELASSAGKKGGAAVHKTWGSEEGAICNRPLASGLCTGTMEIKPAGECTCFAGRPPCASCEDAKLTCNNCHETSEG